MGFLSFLTPKDKKFFPLFEKATENLMKSSELLISLVNATSGDEQKKYVHEIEQLEHAGDKISHTIYNELSENFITPFDREDIHALTSAVDDVLDFIHGAAKRIDMYKIHEVQPAFQELARCIADGTKELHVAIINLHGLKNFDLVRDACSKISSLESKADSVFDTAISDLFDKEKDAIQLIKIKEVLTALETATDKCEDAADVIHGIVIKHS